MSTIRKPILWSFSPPARTFGANYIYLWCAFSHSTMMMDDIRYSILLFLRQEHLGQHVKISRRRKHSDYFRQVRCLIFDFDLFHCFGALGQGLNASFEKRFHNATTQFLTLKSMTMASAGAIRGEYLPDGGVQWHLG